MRETERERERNIESREKQRERVRECERITLPNNAASRWWDRESSEPCARCLLNISSFLDYITNVGREYFMKFGACELLWKVIILQKLKYAREKILKYFIMYCFIMQLHHTLKNNLVIYRIE